MHSDSILLRGEMRLRARGEAERCSVQAAAVCAVVTEPPERDGPRRGESKTAT
jgi:hypothetical protein